MISDKAFERLIHVRSQQPEAIAAAAKARRKISVAEVALRIPQVHGLVVGRALLYPENGDVSTAVKLAAQLLRGGRHD